MTTASFQVADTVEAIDPAWLTGTLSAAGHLDGVRVTEVSSERIGTGQVGQCWRLTVSYDGPTSAPATFVVKLADASPDIRRQVKEVGLYDKELRFYQELLPRLSIRVPRAYYVGSNEDAGTFVLLLEDMAPARQGDQLEGCSLEVATVALNELVGLHAPLWGDESLAKLAWLNRYKTADQSKKVQALPTLWKGFRERYADKINDDILHAGNALVGNIEGFLFAESRPWTVVHGDYRLDNMLIKPAAGGGVDLCVVDWQTCTDGPALNDVAYFLGASLLTEVRREAEDKLVRGYHDRIVDAGVTGCDWGRCWRDYRRGTWAGLLTAIYASMLVGRTDRGDRMFLAMADRHAKHAIDLNAEEVIAG